MPQLRDVIERGLSTEAGILFAIDGAKGLRAAITEVFGKLALIQRWQVHKERNVLDHQAGAFVERHCSRTQDGHVDVGKRAVTVRGNGAEDPSGPYRGPGVECTGEGALNLLDLREARTGVHGRHAANSGSPTCVRASP